MPCKLRGIFVLQNELLWMTCGKIYNILKHYVELFPRLIATPGFLKIEEYTLVADLVNSLL